MEPIPEAAPAMIFPAAVAIKFSLYLFKSILPFKLERNDFFFSFLLLLLFMLLLLKGNWKDGNFLLFLRLPSWS